MPEPSRLPARQRMRPVVLNRRIHYWVGAAVAIPMLVIACSGSLLQIKKKVAWIQPTEQRGTGKTPAVDFEDILASVRSVPELGVTGWQDIDRLDVRPGKGVVKVLLKSHWEAQVDLGTGRVLQTAFRRSDVIEQIHDGSFFAGDWTRYGVFLPAGVALMVLVASGSWMFWQPLAVKRKRARAADAAMRANTEE